jgi:hypothetical protein
MRLDRRLHVEHAVDRRLEGARQLGHHHLGGAAIAAEDRIAGLLLVARTTSPSSTTPRLPGCVLAATGIAASRLVPCQADFGSPTAIGIGWRPSPRCE